MKPHLYCRIAASVTSLAFTFAGLLGAQAPANPSARVDATAIPPDQGAAATLQALRRLHTRASLLMIVAHPDDEDGATLAYESRGLGARVSLLTLDRGEGGANVMSADYWDALGLVRTEELLQAGRYYGLDRQYFTNLADYGFSKSLDEALDQWGHDRVLEAAVRVVRTVRPLVVCSVFVGGPTDGHGQHAVSGLMAQEVFNAAGDPKMFPDQIKAGLLPWSPVKTYGRVPVFRTSEKGMYDYANHTWGAVGVTNHVTGKWEPGKPAVTLEIPSGTFDPALGETYAQVSRTGLGFQASQNGGPGVPLPGPQNSAYHRFGSHIDAPSQESGFFDGIDVTLSGIANLAEPNEQAALRGPLAEVSRHIDAALNDFSAANPAGIAPHLAQGKLALETLMAAVRSRSMPAEAKANVLGELEIKDRQFNDALIAALQISLNADVTQAGSEDPAMAMFRGTRATFQMATPGLSFPVAVHLFQPVAAGVSLKSLRLEGTSGRNWRVADSKTPAELLPSQPVDVKMAVTVPQDEPYTRPYFHRANLGEAFYQVDSSAARNAPLSAYPLQVHATLAFQGATLDLVSTVQTVTKLNGPGLLRFPMPVGPALSVELTPAAGVTPLSSTSTQVSVRVCNNTQGKADPNVRLVLPKGWAGTPAALPIHFSQAGEEQTVTFTVTPHASEGQHYQVTAVAELDGHQYNEGYKVTGYTGLRPYFLYAPATYSTTGTDVKVAPNLNVAYIEGSGDDVPAALQQIGVSVSYLSAQDLAVADLSRYKAIVVGVRAYAVRPDLVANNARLLEYVNKGGVAIVQYNTPEYDHNYGPYPYVMGGDPEEVTDEKSSVSILAADNPVFHWPNQITARDFDGWVEERGSKFLQTWDPHYTALLETHDKGQPEQRGGLLYARYGKGVYVYNAYAFYRELPLGVAGAFRIFANLLSLPENPELKK